MSYLCYFDVCLTFFVLNREVKPFSVSGGLRLLHLLELLE